MATFIDGLIRAAIVNCYSIGKVDEQEIMSNLRFKMNIILIASDIHSLPANLTTEWREDEASKDRPFPSYARVLKERGKPDGESRYSWAVDLAARRAKVREEMQPLLNEGAEIKATVVELKERRKQQKKDKVGKEALAVLDVEIKEKDKTARDLEAKAADIDAAVFDLKAVNPNAVVKVDTRTPQEIITNIDEQRRIVSEALTKLSELLATSDE